MHLLIALRLRVLPHMAIRLEAVGDIGHEADCQDSAEHCRRNREDDCLEISRTHERDQEEGNEENQRRTEVAHDSKQAHADNGKADEDEQILFGVQLVERTRADQNVDDLDQLGGLEGQRTDIDPVCRAVGDLTEYDTHSEQTDRGDHQRNSYFIDGIRVLDQLDDDAEHQKTDDGGNQLHIGGMLILSGKQYRADSREEERKRLQLKGRAPQREITDTEQSPLDHGKRAEEHQGIEEVFAVVPVDRLDGHKEVEEGDHQHQLPRLDGWLVAGILEEPLRLERLVILVAAEELELGIADADDVIDQHLRPLLDLSAIDKGAVNAFGVVDQPALVAPHQHRMNLADACVVDDDIVGSFSADGIFPEQNGNFLKGASVHQRDKRFFGTPSPSHGGIELIDDENRVKRHQNAQRHNTDVDNDRKIKHSPHLFLFDNYSSYIIPQFGTNVKTVLFGA